MRGAAGGSAAGPDGLTPTKAAREFVGDCFGVLHDKKAAICKMCAVYIQCGIASAEYWLKKAEEPVPMPQVQASEPNEPKTQEYRTGSSAWAVWRAVLTMQGEFTEKELEPIHLAIVRLHKAKITPNPKKARYDILERLVKRGVLVKKGRGKWVVVTKQSSGSQKS